MSIKFKGDCLKRKEILGFTLIECLIALSLTLMILSTFRLVLNTSNRVNQQITAEDFFRWQQAVDVLNNESMKLSFIKQDGNTVVLYNEETNKEYHLILKNGVLQLTGDESGYQPLLDNVSFFKAVYDDKNYTLKVHTKIHERDYVKEIIFFKKGERPIE
ncbi:competence type IV pilus minor pilin ComGF [Liquorilactobacillus cacaonum]|uniref:Competence protein ComGF n=1 Tax=Liquorilactobacillus cacaonum DSM 21116 TaxID=1423729 RepID=A0A0R2CU88_9LACO|nr:competence type IV pilus minor pilin ComGF [Liquorilactobacillus cacaonum]KRM91574.1 hypothetical protein FC80_GL000543 [Liquorilactobacillus cacaonum DSM 21116]